jgi:ATP/maltotriose-dependent transcriptional regulator MalT
MSFEEMYPVLRTQALYATMRYDPRKKDKMAELLAMTFVLYKSDIESCKEPNLNNYKSFITKRAREVDIRSVCLKGYGGNSTLDALSPYRRRANQDIEIVEYDDWQDAKLRNKERVEDSFAFPIDFGNWQKTLSSIERRILKLLLNGYTAPQIAKKIKLSYLTVREKINCMKTAFIQYFHIASNKPLAFG